MDCVFCDILEGRRGAHFIYRDDSHVAFLDKYPIDYGHCLIIPKIHLERITDMEAAHVGALFSHIPKIARAILKTTGATGFSLGQNNGRDAKQIVPHVHVHIIPRYKSTGPVWTKREIVDDDDLAALADKIKMNL